MEFYQELLITAVLSVLIAFLIGKIAVLGVSDGDPAVDATVSADYDASSSTGGKSEESAPKETEASAHHSGTEEKHVGTEQEVFVEASKTSSEGASMLRVDEDFSAKLLDTVDNLCSSGDVLKEEEEVNVEGVEINNERESEGGITEEGSLLHGEDEWEGIEKSELEKLFGSAVEYVCGLSSAAALARLSSDVRMELYGLSKIAIEGPCYESQPLPLNFSARSKCLFGADHGLVYMNELMQREQNTIFDGRTRSFKF